MKTFSLAAWLSPSFLVASALILWMHGTGALALLLLYALVLQIVYAVTERKSLFLIGFSGFALAGFYLMWQGNSFWNVGWITTLFIALFLSYESTSQVKEEVNAKEALEKGLTRDLGLWKNRFETLSEKVVSDKEVWGREIDKLNQAIFEKQEEMNSLRVLIQVSHKEMRKAEELLAEWEGGVDQMEFQRILDELNDLRCKHHETELLLQKANQTLEQQQEALHKRQTINESLHTKPAVKPRISLKDLAGKF